MPPLFAKQNRDRALTVAYRAAILLFYFTAEAGDRPRTGDKLSTEELRQIEQVLTSQAAVERRYCDI
jgi:hypothetical protein